MEAQTNAPTKKTGKDVYAIITDRIIEQLQTKGIAPWHQPWSLGGIPRNLISNRPYRGINVMLLTSLGYEHNLFLTFKQVQEIGGRVKQGEHSNMIVFWNYVDRKAKEGDLVEDHNGKKKVALLRYYHVLNIAQCEGIPEKYIPAPPHLLPPIPICEEIVQNMPQCPELKHKEQRAYYNPLQDFVNMPKFNTFEKQESYYSTLFHELVHSTGHHSRLERKDLLQMSEFGSSAYSHEELVAEIGSCYLQSYAGITSEMQQSTAYIKGWLEKLQNDTHFIFSASRHAQKATDFILGIRNEFEEEPRSEDLSSAQ